MIVDYFVCQPQSFADCVSNSMRVNRRSIRVAKQIAGSARTIVIVPLQRESPRDINSKKGQSGTWPMLRRARMNQTRVAAVSELFSRDDSCEVHERKVDLLVKIEITHRTVPDVAHASGSPQKLAEQIRTRSRIRRRLPRLRRQR